MNIDRDSLLRAAARADIPPAQAERLWIELEQSPAKAGFVPAHIAYYFGALVVIGAMGWFMTRGWEDFGGGGLAVIAAGYAAIFVLVGRRLWENAATRIPGGLLITMAVCMAPLAIYGLERASGLWPQNDPGIYQNFHPYINASWVFMEIGTVLAGTIALRFFAFPFLTAPITYALWYMSMDVTALIFKRQWDWQEECHISAVMGAIVLLIAYFIDRKTELDFAFWGYLFGMFMFWGGLSLINSDSEIGKFIYCLINLGLIVLSAVLRRKVFIVFGSLGVFGYLGHLAYTVFRDSILFPFALTLLGLLIIFCAVKYQKNQQRVDDALRGVFLRRI